MEEVISGHKRLTEAHNSLAHQLMEVNAYMKDLRQLTFGYASTLRSAQAAVVEATNVGMHNQRRVTRNIDKTAAMHQAGEAQCGPLAAPELHKVQNCLIAGFFNTILP